MNLEAALSTRSRGKIRNKPLQPWAVFSAARNGISRARTLTGLLMSLRLDRRTKKSMPKRIVRLEGDLWRIRPDQGELDASEQQELRDYFDEIRMPYRIEQGRPCVLGSVSWESIHEVLDHFYTGRAEVYPF